MKQYKTDNKKETNNFPIMVRLDSETNELLTEYANSFPMCKGTAARYILRESLIEFHNKRSKKKIDNH